MKDFLMKVSEDMGYEGDINDEVIEEAQDRMCQHADMVYDQQREHGIPSNALLKNYGNNEDSDR